MTKTRQVLRQEERREKKLSPGFTERTSKRWLRKGQVGKTSVDRMQKTSGLRGQGSK